MSYQPARNNVVSAANSSVAPLTASATFTGAWEDVSLYNSVVVALSTDQDCEYAVQFSPDGATLDSSLTRYYRTATINPPHRFTITRQYVRIVVTNTSATDQTYQRLQTAYGDKADLNAPIDSTLSRNFDAIATRPTDYHHEVSLGLRQGATLWNKFGYNGDFSTTAEVLASWGGTFFPLTTASALSVVSTSTADTNGGTGANNVILYGVDANRDERVLQVNLTGTTPVAIPTTWLGLNRVAIGLSGTGQVNAGTITVTATADSSIQGQIPAGVGTSQQCIFFTPTGHQALMEWLTLNVNRTGGGADPVVSLVGWVYSAVSNTKYEVVRFVLDSNLESHVELTPPLPFPIGESSCFWIEVTSDKAATVANARFSLIDVRDADA